MGDDDAEVTRPLRTSKAGLSGPGFGLVVVAVAAAEAAGVGLR